MTATAGTEKAVNLWPYIWQFTFFYLALSIAAGAVLFVLELDTNAGVNIAMVIASLVFPVRRFAIDHRRPFDKSEQLRFAFLTFVASLLVSLAILAAGATLILWIDASAPSIDELSALVGEYAWLIALVSLVTGLIYFAVLYFTSGFFSRLFSKRLLEKGKV